MKEFLLACATLLIMGALVWLYYNTDVLTYL